MKTIIFILACLVVTIKTVAQDSTFYQNVEWSPDGKKLCTETMTREGNGINFQSYIINLDGNVIERKIANTVFPSWSPDGKHVAYSKITGIKNGSDIWMMNVATGDTAQLTNVPSRNTGVSFSPDGKKICFSSDRDGRPNVYAMNINGNGLEKITTDTFRYLNPVW